MMRTPSILLRLLLCLTLVLNGIGSASAAVGMATAHLHGPGIAATATPNRGPESPATSAPCHGDEPATQAAQAHGYHDNAARTAALDLTSSTDQPCCDAASCQCVCAQTCAGMAIAGAPLHALLRAVSSGHALSLGHQAPALPHLIRPPIS